MPTAPYRMPAPPRPQYASYVPSRRGKVFKTHDRVGDIINALHLRSDRQGVFSEDITLYTLKGDEYVAWMVLAAGSRSADFPELFRS
jgi:hypothetical protein